MAAYEALISLLDSIPPEQRRIKVLPVVRQHLQPFSLDIVMQRCVARHLGALMAGVSEGRQMLLWLPSPAEAQVDPRSLSASLHMRPAHECSSGECALHQT